jgi:hypothetical protein
MVDDKVEMNNDTETFTATNTNDPKNVQELTQYVSFSNITSNVNSCNFCVISGTRTAPNHPGQVPEHVRSNFNQNR